MGADRPASPDSAAEETVLPRRAATPPAAQKPAPPARDAAFISSPASALLGGRYQIERIIGRGRYGRVYRAFDTQARRAVAIKELLAAGSAAEQVTYRRYLARFEREARAAGKIDHPNAVHVYDLHLDRAGNCFLVLEFVDGIVLRDLLVQVGSLPLSRALAITRDIALALDAVHARGVVHADVKPSNIILTQRGLTKLMDFGSAQIGHDSLPVEAMAGSPSGEGYRSPEQEARYGEIDARSDLYSLGLVLYEMLVGQPYARTRQPIAAALPAMPAATIALVERLMAPAPEARYQRASDLLRDLEGLETLTGRMEGRAATPAAPERGATVLERFPQPVAQPEEARTLVVPRPPAAYRDAPPAPSPAAPFAAPRAAPPAGMAPAAQPPPPALPRELPFPAPPPGPPRRRPNVGLFIGIGGALLAVIAAIIIIAIAKPNWGSTATATPTLGAPTARATATSGTTATAPGATATAVTPVSAIPTEAGGGNLPATLAAAATATASGGASVIAPRPTTPATAPPTAPPTVRPTAAGTPQPGGLTTYTDPKNLVRFQYPTGWEASREADDDTNLLKLAGPDNVLFWAFLNDPAQGTIDEEIDTIRKNQDSNKSSVYTNRVVSDTTIAGEPAMTMTYSFAPTSNPASPIPAQWWVVNHGGKQFSFRSNSAGAHQKELDALLASMTFATNGSFAQLSTWTDPKGLVRLQHPSDWTATSDPRYQTNVLELDGPDDTYFFVDIYDPQTGTTVAEEIQDIRKVHANSTEFTYVDGPVRDLTIGGEPAQTFSYTYTATGQQNAATYHGQVWEVNHGGKEFLFSADAEAAHMPEINAIIASVAFPR